MALDLDQKNKVVEAIAKHMNTLGDDAPKWLFETFLLKEVAGGWSSTTNAEKRAIIVELLDKEKQIAQAEVIRIQRAETQAREADITTIDSTITNL